MKLPWTKNKVKLPEYSFCESVHATSISPWCIRKLTDIGRKLGGGVDTESLCGRVEKVKGWDLSVELDNHHLNNNACKKCLEIYAN